MKLSKIFSIGFVALTALSLSAASVSAHNSVKYTNVPFVVAGLCTTGGDVALSSSVNYISQNGKLVLQVNSANQDAPGSGYAGWEVFTSFPGVNPGNITPSPTTTAPSGTYSFTLSGLPSSGNTLVVVSLDALGNTEQTEGPVSNGPVSVVAPAADDVGSPIVSVVFWIFNSSGALTSPYTVSNFTVNNQPLLIDTSHQDMNNSAGFSWCNNF